MAAEALTEDNIPKGGIAGFIMPDEDFAFLEAENARKELGSSGIAEFSSIARRMASYGRFGDDTVAHVQTGEIVVPRRLIEKSPELKESIFQHLRDQGVLEPERYVVGSSDNSINPETGLMEFGFFSDIFNGVKKTLKKISGFVLPAVGSMIFGPVWGAALGTGVATLLQGGDVKDALKAGLGAGVIGGAASFAGGAMKGGVGGGMSALRSAANPANVRLGLSNVGDLVQGKGSFSDTFGNITGQYSDMGGLESQGGETGGFFSKVKNAIIPKDDVTLEEVLKIKFPNTELSEITAPQLKIAESIVESSRPSLFKKYGPLAGAGLAATYLAGGFDVKEEDDIDQETGQDLIDANREKYIVQGLNPYRVPIYAAKGGAMGDVFPRRTGGIMPNEGIPNKDSVKALVMPGEFILTTDAVKGAGGGDLNRGINNLYGVMRNLESIGRSAS